MFKIPVLSGWYERQAINVKLRSGFGAVLGLTAILGISSCVSVISINADAEAYARTANFALTTSRLETEAARATGFTTAYLEAHHDADREKALASMGHAYQLVDEALGLADNAVERKDLADVRLRLDDLGAIVDEAQTHFGAMDVEEVEIDAETLALLGRVEADAAKITADIAEVEEIAAREEAALHEHTQTLATQTEWGISIMVAIVMLIGAGAAFSTSADLSRAVRRLTDAVLRLARGDKGVEVPEQERWDEVGDMARAMEVFKANAAEMEELQREAAEAAQREVEQQKQREEEKAAADEQRRLEMLELAARFEQYVGRVARQVSEASSDVHAAAQGMASSAEQTMNQAQLVGSASHQASSNVMTVASAGDELNESIGEINRQMAGAANITREVVNDVRAADVRIEELANSVARIDDIITLIGSIASRTNMLALNATIEAARAGEAGKGFSVVAAEVKALAGQTRDATSEIAALLGSIRSGSGESAEALGAIATKVGHLEEVSLAVTSAVEQQSLASSEVARSIDEAARGTQLVSDNISQVGEAAQASGATAQQLLGAASGLQDQSEELKYQLGEFLEHLRAA
ncbi:methyl-accepting chemotaxis protein [Sphingomicrobium arenosum]|uniref:methyl-accepting chemotaxis protein n=1 Tax=Sphingomicrobium arenosum TaxID=2233861 RepID=UPI002240F2AB|nr:methyl-accepting chemotaxis protein [Sphingomicrobium arenosum]